METAGKLGMKAVQLVLGELAAEKEQKLRKEGEPYLVNGIS